MTSDAPEGIAIIGMAGRFPGAGDLTEFWNNLAGGVESIRFFTHEELVAAGVEPELVKTPGYVPAAGFLEGTEEFDAYFFGFSAREAEVMDPQHRLFLEQSWVALEAAGYDAASYDGAIGVFGGMNASSYLVNNLLGSRRVQRENSFVQLRIHTDKDFLSSLVAYRMGLTGPCFTVQAACATSLVAVSLACQSLMTYQCDMALAGGVSAGSPTKCGFLAQDEWSGADGHCRAFDAEGMGPAAGSGVAVVVLKRLADALADRDSVRAVIRGFALNNDGSLKVGYTAPSEEGQAEVIAMAQAMAGVAPETIGFVEAHGTGTPLGDPVEVAALTRVFRQSTEKTGFCALGSVKTNVGHLDAAAGVTSLVKTVLALEHGRIPPSLNFRRPNPEIDFAGSPFYVNSDLVDWPRIGERRHAGVSAFAVGGMNAHLVLEEAPDEEPAEPEEPSPQLLVLSAKTRTALDAASARLGSFLGERPRPRLEDVAFTLQMGRRAFNWRRALVCADREEAVAALAGGDPRRLLTRNQDTRRRPVTFLFPGLGEQRPEMGLSLYQKEPVFRREVDRCCEILEPHLGCDLRAELYPRGTAAPPRLASGGPGQGGIDLKGLRASLRQPVEPPREIDRTLLAQPAVFVIEHALAQMWLSLGVEPAALAGFSLGEYTAACLAGVFSLEEALELVARRARLVSDLPRGAMVAVSLPEGGVREFADLELSLAAVCGAESVVLAGSEDQVEELERRLSARGVTWMRLRTSHAFHSRMMEPARRPLVELLRRFELRAPKVPFLSNVTGTWITAEQAADPEYWGDHLVNPVRFSENLAELWKEPGGILLEVGPGRSLGTWALQHADRNDGDGALVVASMTHGQDLQSDRAVLLETLGRIWLAGLEVDWNGLHAGSPRRRVELPPYPFERRRFWIEPDRQTAVAGRAGAPVREEKPSRPEADVPKASEPASLHGRPNLDNPYVAPASDLERRLAAIWAESLGIGEIGVHDDYFKLGGDSMRAPRLLVKVRDQTGAELTLKSLFQAPTVAEMARLIGKPDDGAAAEAEPLDLEAEAVLDPAVVAEGEAAARREDPGALFLTGATGFLGAFLLAELLARTRADVYCLVRAANPASGKERIRRNLELYGVWERAFAERIVAVPGDLGRPLLGIPDEEFDRLGAELDAVYHCGAWVNTTYAYEVLKPANVSGTQEALRLAGRKKTKPLHFISTLAVFTHGGFPEDGVAREDSVLDAATLSADPLVTGYVSSKWVAEKLVGQARERGIPTTLLRSPIIGGHTESGIGNHQDLVWNLLKGCVQLGACFEVNEEINVAPVDYVSRAIVSVTSRPESLGKTFHLSNPRNSSWDRLFEVLRGMGYSLDLMTYAGWHERLMREARSGRDQALVAFLPIVPPVEVMEALRAAQADRPPEGYSFDDSNTRGALEGTGITCPPMTDELVGKYMSSFVHRGILPAAPQGAEAVAGAAGARGAR